MLGRCKPLTVLLFPSQARTVILLRPDLEEEISVVGGRDHPQTPLVIDDIGGPTEKAPPIVAKLLLKNTLAVTTDDVLQTRLRVGIWRLSKKSYDVRLIRTVIDILRAPEPIPSSIYSIGVPSTATSSTTWVDIVALRL